MRTILLFVILCFMSLYGHAYADGITKSETYELQQKLNLLGYNSGNPDGIAGRKTIKATNEFLTANNKEKVNHIDRLVLNIVREEALNQSDIVFSNLDQTVYEKSQLYNLNIPENYEFFVNDERLKDFHNAYGKFVQPRVEFIVGEQECEDALSTFDPAWHDWSNFELENSYWTRLITNISTTVPMPYTFHKCSTYFSQLFFNNPEIGVKHFERILTEWAETKSVIYRGRTKEQENGQGYTALMTLANLAHLYSIYYNMFEFSEDERQKVDQYLKAWLISEDIYQKYHRSVLQKEMTCEDAITAEQFLTRDRFDTDYCGSNRWRLAIAAVYLGLRLSDQDLFRAGSRHASIALSVIDNNGIFMPWARKGAMALSYQRQLPEVLTFLAEAYGSIGYDFYEHETPNGTKIHNVFAMFFRFIDDPTILENYAWASRNYNGLNYAEFQTKSVKEQQEIEMIYPEVLQLQSANYLIRYTAQKPTIGLEKSWYKHWQDYVAVFLSASGVATTFSNDDLSNQEGSIFIALPEIFAGSVNSNKNEFSCFFTIKRQLDDEYSTMGGGFLTSVSGEANIEKFDWQSVEVKGSDVIERDSLFYIDAEGAIKGHLALHTMFGSTQVEYVPFGDVFSAVNPGSPEGIHSAQMNGYRMDAVVEMCRPY